MVIDGSLVSDSPTENRGSFNIIDLPTRLSTNARYVLSEDAQIKISATGTFAYSGQRVHLNSQATHSLHFTFKKILRHSCFAD